MNAYKLIACTVLLITYLTVWSVSCFAYILSDEYNMMIAIVLLFGGYLGFIKFAEILSKLFR